MTCRFWAVVRKAFPSPKLLKKKNLSYLIFFQTYMISFITSQYLSGISKEKTAFLKIFPVLLENSFGFESWTSHFRVVKSALFKAKMKGKDFKEKRSRKYTDNLTQVRWSERQGGNLWKSKKAYIWFSWNN